MKILTSSLVKLDLRGGTGSLLSLVIKMKKKQLAKLKEHVPITDTACMYLEAEIS